MSTRHLFICYLRFISNSTKTAFLTVVLNLACLCLCWVLDVSGAKFGTELSTIANSYTIKLSDFLSGLSGRNYTFSPMFLNK